LIIVARLAGLVITRAFFSILFIVDVASHIYNSLKLYKAFFNANISFVSFVSLKFSVNTYFNIAMASDLFSSLSQELEGLDMLEILEGSLPGEGVDLVGWFLEGHEGDSGLSQAVEGEGPHAAEGPQAAEGEDQSKTAPIRGNDPQEKRLPLQESATPDVPPQDADDIAMLQRCLEPWEPHEDLKVVEEQYFMDRCLSPWTQDGSGIPLTSKSCYIYFNVVLYTNIRLGLACKSSPGICL